MASGCGESEIAKSLCPDAIARAQEAMNAGAHADAYSELESAAQVLHCKTETFKALHRRAEMAWRNDRAREGLDAMRTPSSGPRISVPTDSGAIYRQISIAPRDGFIEIVTERTGQSGRSYARRVIDCSGGRFRYDGEADSVAALEATPRTQGSMSDLTAGSISTFVAIHACKSGP